MGARAGVAGAVGKRTVGGDAQRQRIAGDQALDRLGRGPRLILAAAAQRIIGLPDAGFAEPGQRDADRQERRGQDQKQLGRGRQPREALGDASCRGPRLIGVS